MYKAIYSEVRKKNPNEVKKIIEPILKTNGYKVKKRIGDIGNNSVCFEGYNKNLGEMVVFKCIIVNKTEKSKQGYVLNERIAEKETTALLLLKKEEYVTSIIDCFDCPITYGSAFYNRFGDYIKVMVLKHYDSFAIKRDKNDKMTYSSIVNKWIKRYSLDVVAAYIGKALIEAVNNMYEQKKIFHRDIKSFNILLEISPDGNMFSSKIILADFGFCHIHSFDDYSEDSEDGLTDGSININGGTIRYYPPANGPFSIENEYYAIGLTLCDLYGYLRIGPEMVRAELEEDFSGLISNEMQEVILSLISLDSSKRDVVKAINVFSSIIEKAKDASNDKGNVQSSTGNATKSSPQKTKTSQTSNTSLHCTRSLAKKEKHTLEDVEKAILKGKPEKALTILKNLENYSAKAKRLKGIALYLNDDETDAKKVLGSVSVMDLWAMYLSTVMLEEKERNRSFERLYFKCRDDDVLFPLVCYHIDKNKNNTFYNEPYKSIIKKEALKVNPEKTKFKQLLEIAVKAA